MVGRRAGEASRILPADSFNRTPEHHDVTLFTFLSDKHFGESEREHLARSQYARDAGANHSTTVTGDRATNHDTTDHCAGDHCATDDDATDLATDDDATDHYHDISEWGRCQLLTVALWSDAKPGIAPRGSRTAGSVRHFGTSR